MLKRNVTYKTTGGGDIFPNHYEWLEYLRLGFLIYYKNDINSLVMTQLLLDPSKGITSYL